MQNSNHTNSKYAKYEALKSRLLEINHITSAAGLLYWDQATYMPPGGATARGRQISTWRQIAHSKLTDPTLGELLEDLRPEDKQLDFSRKVVACLGYDFNRGRRDKTLHPFMTKF